MTPKAIPWRVPVPPLFCDLKVLPTFLGLLAIGLAVPFARADDRTWNGGGANDLWSTGLNWGGLAPVAGDALFFGGSTRLTPDNDLAADTLFGGITFNSDAGAFVLSGNRITLGGDVVNSSGVLQTISLAMVLDAPRTIDAGPSGMTLSGVLSGPGGIVKQGGGTLTLSGSGTNTYEGLTEVAAGQLTLGKTGGATAVGGDLTLSGAGTALVFTSAGAQNQIANSATVTLNGVGSVLGNTAANFGLVVGATTVTEEIANLNVTNGMFFTGSGTWTISGAGFFDGATGDARYLHNSGGTVNFGSLSLAGMTGTGSGAADSFVVLGNNTSLRSTVVVGSGGLSLDNSRLILSLGSNAGTLGSRLVLNGNVSTTGTSASFIQLGGGALGTASVELSGTGGDHTRTFTVAGGGADLTVNVAIINGGATIGSLIKDGAGTLLLSGSSANTYTGLTTVSEGILNLGKTGGVNAVGGDLTINGSGDVIFAANGTQDQIPDSAKVIVNGAGSTFNGTGSNLGTRTVTETIAALEVLNGNFNTGSGSNWTVTGAGVFDGTGAADSRFIGNSGSSIRFGSLSVTAMAGTLVNADSFALGGASTAAVTTVAVGSGGLVLNGSTIRLNIGGTATGQLGSRLILDGDLTTTGTSSSGIVVGNSGTDGIADLELSSTAGDHVRTFDVGGGGANLTIGLAITDGAATSGGILKTGAGTMTLSGNNTYTGDTTVNEGILAIGASERIRDTSNLIVSGTGTFNLGPSRNETVAAVSVSTTDGGIVGTGTSTLVGTSYAISNDSGTATIDVALGGGGTLTKTGNGTLLLSGGAANTYSGLTSVSTGILRLGKTGGVNAIAGDLTISGSGDLTFAAGGAQNQIADSSHVLVDGTGGSSGSTFNGTGANEGWQSSLNETIGSLTVRNGNFNTGPTSTWTIAGEGVFDGTGANDARFIGNSGSVTHFGGLTLTAMTGTVIVSGADGFVLGGANNTIVSTVSVGAGGLTLDGSTLGLNRGGSSSNAGSRLVLDGDVTTIGSAASSIAVVGGTFNQADVELSSTAGNHVRTFDIGGGGANLSIGATITDGVATSGGILKEGAGILILTGANTYTGATTVGEGTLIVNGDQTAASGAIGVDAGATLGGSGGLGGHTEIAGNLRVGSNTSTGTTGNLDFGGNDLSFQSGSTWFIDIVGANNDSLLNIDVLTIAPDANLSFHFSGPSSTTYTLASYASRANLSTFANFDEGTIFSGYQIHYGDQAITLTAIPEPGTLALLGLGTAGFFFRRLRKRRSGVSASSEAG